MTDQIARSQVAPLRTINLLRLSQGDKNELEELVLAAKREGMFYLDFTDHDSGPYPALVEDIYSLSQSIFNLSLEEKLQYDIDVLGKFKTNGYVPTVLACILAKTYFYSDINPFGATWEEFLVSGTASRVTLYADYPDTFQC